MVTSSLLMVVTVDVMCTLNVIAAPTVSVGVSGPGAGWWVMVTEGTKVFQSVHVDVFRMAL